ELSSTIHLILNSTASTYVRTRHSGSVYHLDKFARTVLFVVGVAVVADYNCWSPKTVAYTQPKSFVRSGSRVSERPRLRCLTTRPTATQLTAHALIWSD